MKSRKIDLIIIATFIIFIYGIAIGNLVCKDRTFSEMENRMLAQMPKVNGENILSGQFMTDFESYVTDQFIFRDNFIRLKSAGERFVGKKINNGVYYGKDGYLAEQLLFLNNEQLDKNLNAIKNYLDNTTADVYFALIPGSVEINRDIMPLFISDVNQKEVINNIYSELAVYDVTCVDIYGTLLKNKSEDLYYRTDHHWTSLGAYYGYRALCNTMNTDPVSITEYDKELQSDDFYGTLYSKTGAFWIKPDFIETYVKEDGITVERIDGNTVSVGELYHKEFLNKKDKYSMFLGGNQPLAVIRTNHSDMPKILVIRDSYFDSMAPFLTAHYSEIHVVDFRYNRGNVEKYIEDNDIEDVLIIYSLANFHEDKNIGYVLGNITKPLDEK